MPEGMDRSNDAEVLIRYQNRYRFQDGMFKLLDFVTSQSCSVRGTASIESSPRRLLLINAGHLGDVIISTALLPVLHVAYPGIEIGFLTGSYSKIVVSDHPLIHRCHVLDHWFLKRKKNSLPDRILRYRRDSLKVAKELRSMEYDTAIDVRAWFPNLIKIPFRARIPNRIAYGRVGGASMLTKVVSYQYDRRHELEHQLDLLRAINIGEEFISYAAPSLPPITSSGIHEISSMLAGIGRFRVLHPGSSTPLKDWNIASWRGLVQNLAASSITPIVTGLGERERKIAAAVTHGIGLAVNACDALTWNGLVALISRAELVYSVDTSIGHIAWALGKPVVAIFGGMADPCHWAPLTGRVATNPIHCNPCIRKGGCHNRKCLTGLTVNDVETAADKLLAAHDVRSPNRQIRT